MTFISQQKVRFAHVDAAGIVFYPRYFEMLNAAVEDFFAEQTRTDFRAIHLERGLSVPTVKLESEFSAPSRLGDVLEFCLDLVRIGRSSMEFAIRVRCGAEPRFQARVVLVCMDLKTSRSVAWPAEMRPRIEAA